MKRPATQGFSLIELLIVVAIILVLAAIAVPNFINSKMRANESSACGSLRQINTAETTYTMTFPDVGYAQSFQDLGPGASVSSTSAGLLDDVLGCPAATCNKSGYVFSLSATSTSYSVLALPQAVNQSGRRAFYTDGSGVIRFNGTGTGASVNDPAI